MDWKIDAKSGIRYRDPDNVDQPIFYVTFHERVVSRGYAPMIYWYEWRYVGPFIYSEALKQRKMLNGIITTDIDRYSNEIVQWYPCWYNREDYRRDERYPHGHPARIDTIHYRLV